MAETDPSVLCADVSSCCGVPSDGTFKKWVVGFLCAIASASDDVEYQILCDAQGNGSYVPFVRRVTRDEEGNQTVENLDISDYTTPYVITGTVGPCPQDLLDSQFVVLCDNNGGVYTEFLRKYSVDEAGVVTIADTTLDGTTTYVTTGTVEACPEKIDYDPAVFPAQGTLAGASITTVYQSIRDLPDNTRIVYLFNYTDVLIEVSIDGGATTWGTLADGLSVAIDLGATQLETTADVQVRHLAGAPVTIGDFFVSSVGA